MVKFYLFSTLDRRLLVSTGGDVIQSAENLKKLFDMKCDANWSCLVCSMPNCITWTSMVTTMAILNAVAKNSESSRMLKITFYITIIRTFSSNAPLLLVLPFYVTVAKLIDIFYCRCSICDRKFKRMTTLSGHISRHRAVDAEIFKCDKCNRVCTNNFQLMRHKNVHLQPDRKLPCNQCERK